MRDPAPRVVERSLPLDVSVEPGSSSETDGAIAFGAEIKLQDPLLRKVLEVLPIGVWIIDAQGRIIYGNTAGRQIWGGARFVGIDHYGEYRGFWAATGKPIAPNEWAAARAISKGEASLDEEVEIECFDGSKKTILNSAVPIWGDQQQLLGAVVLNHDITERKRNAKERDRLLTALEQAGEAIFVTRPDGAIEYTNDAFQAITGYERSEVIGKTPRFLKSGQQAPEFYEGLWKTIVAGLPWRGRMVNRRKDGTHFVQDATISPTFDAAGRVVNFVAVTRDVTDQVRREERSLAAQKLEAIGTLAGGVAHDFNNLLSVILGYTRIAIKQLAVNDPLRADLEEITIAGERAVALTRQLLAFGRKQVFERKLVYCNDIVNGMTTMLRRLIGETIRFDTSLCPDVGRVLVDRGQLEQALMNLVINARDAMPTGGVLSVETQNIDWGGDDSNTGYPSITPGEYVQITVTDSGCGMDDATLLHAFEPFFTTKAKDKGTGLGLSTVHGIVQQSGGAVGVRSSLGHGTKVSLYLPRHDSEVATPPNPQVASVPCRGTGGILIVEDEAAVRSSTIRLLTAAGYEVYAAASGAEALEVFDKYSAQIQLVLTDVIMPEMSGVQLASILSTRNPRLLVLFMSGYPDDALKPVWASGQHIHIINKPFACEELECKIWSLLNGDGKT